MCLYPKLIKNRRYIANKSNGGIIPSLPLDKYGNPDKRVLAVPIGCNKCIECRKKKARDWQVRLSEEVRNREDGVFVTLTLSDKSIRKLSSLIDQKLKGYDRDYAIGTLAVRRFLERWRKRYGKSVRHWLVTELGHKGTENLHLHGFIFTMNYHMIEEIWKYGYVWTSKKQKGGKSY